MIETAEVTPISTAGGALGPGDRLQAARIEKGLTLEDVARKMHLSESILSSLEENRFEEITAPIFVKGYLRSYARIVEVDEEEIIRQYSHYYTDGDPPISSTSNTSPEINADDARVKWFTWLIIFILMVLLMAWWWNRYQQPAETLSLDTTNTPGILSVEESESTPEPQVDTTDVASQNSLGQQVQEELSALVHDQETFEMTSQQAGEVENAQPEQVGEPATSDIPSETTTDTQAEAVPPSVSAADMEKGLVITVNADTWANIRDASGNKLVYDLLRAGQQVTVNGTAPLRVFLGNGHGVSMRYNGEAVDISQVIKSDNTARINIGQ